MPAYSHPVPRSGKRLRIRALLALCLLGACAALAACGGSGGGSSSAAKTSGASASKAGGPGRFTALRTCLQKQGITLPSAPSRATRQPGGPGSGAPGGAAGGFQLPKGVTQTQLQAALKKCGAGNLPRGRDGAFNSASARAGLVKYAACLRQNGIDVPAPNTTGKGPVFSTEGIDTSSSKFKAARSKCQSVLKGVFPGAAGGGAPPSGAPNGPPPAGAGAPPAGEVPAG